jgi:arylsulfatase
MKFIILAILSLIQLAILLWHIYHYRSKKVFWFFLIFGIAFGFLRAQIINLVQVVINHAYTPYAFNNPLLKIGNDSLQIYIGWISTVYFGWCIAEMILKVVSKYIGEKNLEKKIFPIISVAYFVVFAFSYSFETLSSFMKWWSWNQFLETGFNTSLFVNVPWIGLFDIATVAIEYLGIFLIIRHAWKQKTWRYLWILLFPMIHWSIKLNVFKDFPLFNTYVYVPQLIHLAIPLVATGFFFIKKPQLDDEYTLKEKNDRIKADWYVWGALSITFVLSLILIAVVGKNAEYLISLIPLTIFFLMYIRINIPFLWKAFFGIAVLTFFLPIDLLIKKRIVVAMFPLAYIAVIFLFQSARKSQGRIIKILLIGIGILLFLGLVFSFVPPKRNDLIYLSSLKNINKEDKSIPIPTNPQFNKSQKKVVLVSIDTLQASHLGVYGYSRNTSDRIDEFAKAMDATVFPNAYTPIPATFPAHAAIFTGLNLPGIYLNDIAESLSNSSRIENTGEKKRITLTQIFQNNGYKTAAFYSSQVLERAGVLGLGFETYNPELGYHWPKNESSEERSAEGTNIQAFNWLNNNYQNDFFLWIHYYEPHNPYTATCAQGLYSKGLKPTNPDYVNGSVAITESKIWGNVTQADYTYLEAKYDEEIYCMDKQFGKLVDKLKALGIYDDTTIILVGDHGENFDHQSLFHGSNLYQSAMHIPFIVKSPLIKVREKSTPVSLIDIAPSLVDFFELQIPDSAKFDGISINSLSRNKERTLFMESALTAGDSAINYGLIYQNFKLINNRKTYELYNTVNDPVEKNNLIDVIGSSFTGELKKILSTYKASK